MSVKGDKVLEYLKKKFDEKGKTLFGKHFLMHELGIDSEWMRYATSDLLKRNEIRGWNNYTIEYIGYQNRKKD